MSKTNRKYRRTIRIEDIAHRVCQIFGASDDELAQVLDISEKALAELKSFNAEFAKAIWRGQTLADADVVSRLHRLAMGYTRTVTISYLPDGASTPVVVTYEESVPADVTACIHWLRNRQPALWGKVADIRYHTENVFPEHSTLH